MSLPQRSRAAGRHARVAGAAAVGLALALCGCESFQIGGRTATLTYTDDARAAYGEALKAFKNKDWEDARTLFKEVKRLFAYSRYARLAELRLADIDFAQEKFTDAITAYRQFVQDHRNDPELEYARYRTAKALFKDIDDTILLPPAEERDQATAYDAYKELRSLVRDYPSSRYKVDIAYMLDVVTGRLVRHELYVARYYLRQDEFKATIMRVDYALKYYPGSKLEPEALVLKGETLMKMKKLDEAREVFESVRKDYGGMFTKTAERFLEEIRSKDPRAKGGGPPGGKAK